MSNKEFRMMKFKDSLRRSLFLLRPARFAHKQICKGTYIPIRYALPSRSNEPRKAGQYSAVRSRLFPNLREITASALQLLSEAYPPMLDICRTHFFGFGWASP